MSLNKYNLDQYVKTLPLISFLHHPNNYIYDNTPERLMHRSIEFGAFEQFFDFLYNGVNPYVHIMYATPSEKNKFKMNTAAATAQYYNSKTIADFLSITDEFFILGEGLVKSGDTLKKYYEDMFVQNGVLKERLPVLLFLYAMTVSDPKLMNSLVSIAKQYGYTHESLNKFDGKAVGDLDSHNLNSSEDNILFTDYDKIIGIWKALKTV